MLFKLGLRSCFSLLNQMYTGQDLILTITPYLSYIFILLPLIALL